MNKSYRYCFLALTFTVVIFSACSRVSREEYVRIANNRMQILAKKYNAKISPLIPDSIVKEHTNKKLNKKEIELGEENLAKLERYLATYPDSMVTNVDIKFKAPSEVIKVDSIYFNVYKWDYLQQNGLVTKNTHFEPREAK